MAFNDFKLQLYGIDDKHNSQGPATGFRFRFHAAQVCFLHGRLDWRLRL